MDLLTILGSGVVGGVAGWAGKLFSDWFSAEHSRRYALQDQVIKHTERFASTYNLMSNHASLLAGKLTAYLRAKRVVQLMQIDGGGTERARRNIEETAGNAAREALFYAVKLYRVMSDLFWTKGGKYYLPDRWASEAIEDLHNELVAHLNFQPQVVLKYVKVKTDWPEFFDTLETANTNPGFNDIRQQEAQFRDWLLKSDAEAKELAAFAYAYADLFDQEIGSLWSSKLFQGKRRQDPREAREVKAKPSMLLRETQGLVRRAADDADLALERRRKFLGGVVEGSTRDRDFSEHFDRGWNYYVAGQYDLALEEYSNILHDPPDPDVLNNLGNTYLAQGNAGKAEEMYLQAIDLDQKNAGRQGRTAIFEANLAALYYRQNKYPESIQRYQTALALDAPSGTYYNELGNAYYSYALTLQGAPKTGRLDNACENYRLAIDRSPKEPVLYANLAGALAEKLDYAAAVKLYGTSIELSAGSEKQKAEYHAAIAKLQLQMAQPEQAAGEWRKALAADLSNSLFAVQMVRMYEDAGLPIPDEDYELALAACHSATPDDAVHHYRAGQIHFSRRDYERALFEHDTAVRMDPEKADYHSAMGLAYRRLGRWEMAFRSYATAIHLAPENLTFVRNLALAFHAQQLYDFALPNLDRVLAKQPEDIDCKLAAAECYAYGHSKNTEKALSLCNTVITQHPEDPRAYESAGGFYYSRADFPNCLQNYEAARSRYVAKSPNDAKRMLESLASVCDQAIAASPGDSTLRYERGRICELQGDYEDAVAEYQRALAPPNDTNPKYRVLLSRALGNVSFKQADYKQGGDRKAAYNSAIQYWQSALRDVRDNPSKDPSTRILSKEEEAQIENNIGTAYDWLGQRDDAMRQYMVSANLAPDKYQVHYNLGSALYRRKVFDQSLSKFQEAFRLAPKVSFIPYQIGNCYYRLGFKDLAVAKWQEALTLDPANADATCNLGVVAFEAGKKDIATHYWDRVLKLNPQSEAARRCLSAAAADPPAEVSICELAMETERDDTPDNKPHDAERPEPQASGTAA
ncbi:MAG: tetratricopeptide repeat protein [Acidobacteriaceae bacterium]|nr:tetratricopeptide repeat protein [Acidobacteriaceae bacterium]MBV9781436.1 tetratricopeptide repeat protein [Acidobacteriaceae bacterium]